MGEAEALDKAWLVGRGVERGEMTNSYRSVYGYKDDGESYSLSLEHKGDNTPLIII